MRAPPPVLIRCRTGRCWRFFHACCLGLAGAVVVWRLGLHDMPMGRTVPLSLGLLSAIGGLLLAWAGWRLSAAKQVELQWSGQGWSLDGQGLRGVEVRFDGGHWMLLHCAGAPRQQRWQAAQEDDNRSQWAVWRAAVYCAANGVQPEPES